jgi:predicted DCC family thiol-disulfide oxidoreductase YuxK
MSLAPARVASPPAKPLMIYDGDCRFCYHWIRRWQLTTGDSVDYVPYQEPSVATRFPEIPVQSYEHSVHLIETDGTVHVGAAAALRTLAKNPHERWLLELYEHYPLFARASEWTYGFVARHRHFFSKLTRLFWGEHVGPLSYQRVRTIFVRLLALIYFVAFLSLWVQIPGLAGSRGILPANETMNAVRHELATRHAGLSRYQVFPTLCWWSASDRSLKVQCLAGILLSVVLLVGFFPAPVLFLLWLIYLSLTTVCQDFLSFQWDNLLLETGFLAIFFAPLTFWLSRPAPVSNLAIWLMRWLLFRLMFASGVVKLASGDSNWHQLTALSYHYETQPLPTWLGWYAHHLPGWLQKSSTLLMFAIELPLPFLIFAPRRLRHFACVVFILFQSAIFLTGNYCFFNLLAIVLCLPLLDDKALANFRLVKATTVLWQAIKRKLSGWWPRVPEAFGTGAADSNSNASETEKAQRLGRACPAYVLVTLACVIGLLSAMEFAGVFRVRIPWPRQFLAVYSWAAPFRSVNSYGLFQVMTTSRPEIVVEGSNDGVTWSEYEFKYKPGDLKRRPGFVEPHQPRLDWQMWFAALGTYRYNPWFVNFCVRLLQGSPDVLALMGHNPFPNAPPRYIRAVLYDYHYTDLATHHRTGEWWRRDRVGFYMPVMALQPGK